VEQLLAALRHHCTKNIKLWKQGKMSGGMTPGRVKRLENTRSEDDFMPDYQGRAWPEYKSISQAGIYGYPGWCSDMPV
jgi:hypothetical protein